MPGWLAWSIAAVLLAVGEIFTPGLFFLGPVAVAAFAAAVAAALIGGAASLVVFICVCVASLGILRPLARRHLKMPALSRTGAPALIGTRAIVLQHVDCTGGRVKIGGEEWSARAFLDDRRWSPARTSRSSRSTAPRRSSCERERHHHGPADRARRHRGADPADRRPDHPHRPSGQGRGRRAARPLPADAPAGARAGHPVRRSAEAIDRPARAGRLLRAAAGHHRGQPRRQHRHGHLLPGHRREVGDLRDRELHRRQSSS